MFDQVTALRGKCVAAKRCRQQLGDRSGSFPPDQGDPGCLPHTACAGWLDVGERKRPVGHSTSDRCPRKRLVGHSTADRCPRKRPVGHSTSDRCPRIGGSAQNPYLLKDSFFCFSSRSESNLACFVCCQQFCSPKSSLPSAFKFIFHSLGVKGQT